MKTVTLTRELPVEETEVLVIGGGPAGIASAIASARNGVKTILVEQSGCLGGMATLGLVGPFMSCFSADGKTQLIRGIFDELVRRMEERGGAIHPSKIPGGTPFASFYVLGHDHVTPFEPEILKMVALEMCEESGVKVKLYTPFLDTITTSSSGKVRIDEVVTANKPGLRAIRAERIVDCTGNGDVAASSGVPVNKGREKDKKMQPATLFFRVGNVDSGRLISFVRKTYEPRIMGSTGYFMEHVKRARKEIGYSVPRDWLSIYQTMKWDEWLANTTRVHGIDGTNVDDLTRAHREGLRQVFEVLEFLRKYIPGCENVELVNVAQQIGIRETRRIQGEYVLTADDVYNCKDFEDVVVLFAFPVDIHDPEGGGGMFEGIKGNSFQVPYRCLLPLKVENLLVAGRCISATHEALGAIREMPCCFGMGEAAGTAAALSVKKAIPPKELNYQTLQKNLVKQGAYLPDVTP